MNHFVHGKLGHFLMDEAEEGQDLGGAEVPAAEEEEAPNEDEDPEDDEDGEVVITLGDQSLNEPEIDDNAAPQWAKDLRKAQRELRKENKELKAKLSEKDKAADQNLPEVGPKPKLSDPDIDYDEDKLDAKLTAWYDRKRAHDDAAAQAQRQQEDEQRAWQAKLDGYGSQKAKLNLPDFDDAEAVILESMGTNQQGIILSGADNPALVIYALGKNPDKAKELAAIQDPVKFAFAIAKLETQVKMSKKTSSKPEPERAISGSGPKSGAVDSNLDRLRADAEKSGDYSKVHAYRKQQREKERARG